MQTWYQVLHATPVPGIQWHYRQQWQVHSNRVYVRCFLLVDDVRQGPVLVTQGVKDPLNDAEGRATLFQELGPQVDVVRVDGGHW